MLTHGCNLACVYCYEKVKSGRRISFETAKQAIINGFQRCSDGEELEISFHGGEPFLAFELLRDICEWVWSQTWPAPYICFATTNGTLVHGHIQDWVASNRKRLHLGLSLDGTRDMHNLNRSRSFDLIDMNFFLVNWPNQPLKMTVSDISLPFLADGIAFLHHNGFRIHANFAFGMDWSDEDRIDELTRQLTSLIQFYLDNPQFEPCNFLAMPIETINPQDSNITKWCGAGTEMLAVDVDGKEYPCQMFLPMVNGKDILAGRPVDWTDTSSLSDDTCRDCIISKICPTCYGMNLMERNNPRLRDPYLCALTKVRAVACSCFQAQLLSRNSSAIETPDQAAVVLRKIQAIEAIQSDKALRKILSRVG
jgi:radical SAM protein with 4Fe4S-binding SPASM domain